MEGRINRNSVLKVRLREGERGKEYPKIDTGHSTSSWLFMRKSYNLSNILREQCLFKLP